MTRLIAIGVLFVFLSETGIAQVAPERWALRAIEKKRWQKAQNLLRRSIRKDSVNALARYCLSKYFFSTDNPSANLDSAYHYILQSAEDFEKSSVKALEKMQRLHLDSNDIVLQRKQIDSAAFEYARQQNTEEAFITFMDRHPYAEQLLQAQDLRDEMAYLHALKTGSYQSFAEFLKKYPRATRAPEARQKYDRLLYESKTSDKQLRSFEDFLGEHPETPFRREIEQQIFELFTISGDIERYLSFIQRYPQSAEVKKANDILYHILQDKEESQWSGLFASDSLENIHKLQQGYMVPIFHNNRYGFIDDGGLEIIPPVIEDLDDAYRCGNITEDVIVLSDRILARDKNVIYSGSVDDMLDLGTGFLKIKSLDCYAVIHKSGFTLEPCVQDAKVLDGRFVAISKDSSWSIYALTGKKILSDVGKEILLHRNILSFRKHGLWTLITVQQMLKMADQQQNPVGITYNEVKFTGNDLVWVKKDGGQAILNQSLNEVIPFGPHKISPAFFGFIGKSREGFSLYTQEGKPASYFDKVEVNNSWIKVQLKGLSYLYDESKHEMATRPYDSIRFEGPFAIAQRADSTDVYFSRHAFITIAQPLAFSFIPGKDSTSFLVVATKKITLSRRTRKFTELKTVYAGTGKELFSINADQVEYAGNDLFIIHQKDKKGLVSINGKNVLPTEFDAIGSVVNNVVSVLKAGKFGLYHTGRQKLIKPQYDKNLVPYNDDLIVTFNGGSYGFVDWNGKMEAGREFNDITYWNDTSALVKRNELWSVYDIVTKRNLVSDIREIKIVGESPDEKVAIVRQKELYGVLSNRRGIVIPFTFSDIINVGSTEEPMYFTEKHVSEAAIFVVIYYDKNGKLLRREVYEEAEDYEKIYCAD